MKTLYTCILLSLGASLLSAQGIQQEFLFSETPYIRHHDLVNVGGKTYLAGSFDSCKSGLITILGHDNTLIGHVSMKGGYWEVDDLVYHEETGTILGSGFYKAGDDFDTELDGPYLFSIDLDGNLLFDTHLPNDWEVGGEEVYLNYTPAGDGLILLAGTEKMVTLSLDGTILEILPYPGIQFKGVHRAGDVLFAYSATQVYRVDATGQAQEVFTGAFANGIKDMEVDADNGRLFFLLDNGELFHTSYATMDGIFNLVGDFLGSATLTGNSSHLFLYNGGNEALQLDKSNLSLTGSFGFNNSHCNPTGLYVTDSTFQLTGGISPESAFTKSTPIGTALSFDNYDISISNVQLLEGGYYITDSTIVSSNTTLYEFGAVPALYSYDVTNNGSHPINKFTLRRYSSGIPVNCSSNVSFEQKENILIPAGSTVTITQQSSLPYWGGGAIPYSSISGTISRTIFSPNNRFDDISDNGFSISVGMITPTQEILGLSDVRVYPNPATDVVYLEGRLKNPSEQLGYRLQNLLGQTLRIQDIPHAAGGFRMSIPVSDLERGIYILSLSNGNGNHTEKIVLER